MACIVEHEAKSILIWPLCCCNDTELEGDAAALPVPVTEADTHKLSCNL